MSCPHCGRASGAATPPCPRCPDYALPAPQTSPKADAQVVEPEVLDPHESPGSHREHPRGEQVFFRTFSSGGSQNGFGQFRFATWNGGSPLGGGASCLPGMITLLLVLMCGAQFGFLAALGFVFFYVLGSGLTSVMNLQLLMQGRALSPALQWVPRGAVWAVSWLLTAWLSGGL